MKVIVFDLDDTLYSERSFVESGFRAVANHMCKRWRIPRKKAYRMMIETLDAYGRDGIFDAVLANYGKKTKSSVRECLQIYRTHKPTITFYPDAKRALHRIKTKNPIYVVTDGNAAVQRRKADALHLKKFAKKIIATRSYGIKNEKPSPYCFLRITQEERVAPSDMVYIADDPHKDFIGIKKLGVKTIRLKRGKFENITLDEQHEADLSITKFDELYKYLE